MRSDNDLIEIKKAVVNRRLLNKYIEGCTCNLAGFNRLIKSFLIDNSASCTVDEVNAILALLNCFTVKETLCVFG